MGESISVDISPALRPELQRLNQVGMLQEGSRSLLKNRSYQGAHIEEGIFGDRVSRRAPAERLKKQGKQAKSR
jgi:hypothetical protein